MSVLSCKALGMGLRSELGTIDAQRLRQLGTAVLLVVGCIVVQMNYLNRALDTFSTAVVTPVYYVVFTTLTLLASFVLFRSWEHTDMAMGLATAGGFLAVALGVKLLKDSAAADAQP